jgi:hypothetical protein
MQKKISMKLLQSVPLTWKQPKFSPNYVSSNQIEWVRQLCKTTNHKSIHLLEKWDKKHNTEALYITTIALGKQQILNITSVCLCTCLSYLVC